MAFITDIADRWLGLCRKPPVVRTSQRAIRDPPGSACMGRPGGGGGGAGTIRMGVGAAVSGIKTLVYNPQLLWFPLLNAFVILGLSVIQGMLVTITSSLEWQAIIGPYISQWRFFVDPFLTSWWPGFYPIMAGLLYSLCMTGILTIVAELVTVFCLVLLLAGLILGISSKEDCPVSFFHGLAMAGTYLRPLAAWSIIMALAGTMLFIAFQYSCALSPAIVLPLSNVLNQQNPFNYVLDPNFPASVLPEEVFTLSFAPMYIGLINTLILSGINTLLFILTLFVIPHIVLAGKSLKVAVVGSFTLMNTTWAEVVACFISLGTIVSAASLASLLFPAISGGNIAVGHWPPPDGWLAAGVLYVLALSILAFVIVTVGGIAARDLYLAAETGQVP